MRHPRTAVAALSVSAMLLVTTIVHEGWTDKAIIPVKGDVPTVGPGLTKRPDGSPVQIGDTITPIDGVKRSFAHIQKDETVIKSCVKAPLSQVEYDLMVDFSYQYGAGTLCGSNIVKYANAQEYTKSCQAYADYRFMTSSVPHPGWVPFRFNSNGAPIRWRFDCSTPGNRVCMGVWTRQKQRIDKCLEAQK